MAKVKPEDIIENLKTPFKKALVEAVNQVIPNTEFDQEQLFREFKKQIRFKCSTWERVPSTAVQDD
jgi:hypothetical protein